MNTEYARLLISGLEFSKFPPKSRSSAFEGLKQLVGFFSGEDVHMRVQSGFYAHKFSFGNIYNDFIYASWPEVSANKALEGITQTVHQALAASFMPHPFGDKEISDVEWNALKEGKADYGMRTGAKSEPYVTDSMSWHEVRSRYYREHPGAYVWCSDDDDFFPNRRFSDLLLEKEIERAGKKEKYEEAKNVNPDTALATIFHSDVAAARGRDLAGYTEEIGSKVCEANFYAFEAELTAKETHLNKGSLRSIWSAINRHGEKQYISLDFRHCMMEFHDKSGNHLGEFRFTAQPNSPAEVSHNLKCIDA